MHVWVTLIPRYRRALKIMERQRVSIRLSHINLCHKNKAIN